MLAGSRQRGQWVTTVAAASRAERGLIQAIGAIVATSSAPVRDSPGAIKGLTLRRERSCGGGCRHGARSGRQTSELELEAARLGGAEIGLDDDGGCNYRLMLAAE